MMRACLPFLRHTVVALLLSAAVFVPRTAFATSNLHRELVLVANSVVEYIKKAQEGDAVSIGEFTAPPALSASAGSAIKQILTDEIRKCGAKNGVEVRQGAKLTVKGSYRDVIDDASKRLAAQIQVSLEDERGKELQGFDRGVFGDATLSSLFGVTGNIPPNVDEKVRDQKMQEALDKPSFSTRGARISPSSDSPYGVEILIKSGNGYYAREPTEQKGLAYVPIRRDEIYAIRLYNDTSYEAAVTLSIDGLNVFSFSENKNYTQWIIPPRTPTMILGWHKTNQATDTFMVTEYSKSKVAVKMPHSTTIGTITASFAAAWPKGSSPPGDEPVSPHEYARSADATGEGPRVTTNYQEVKRLFGVTRAAVSVRYTK